MLKAATVCIVKAQGLLERQCRPLRLTRDVALRLVADLILVNVALMIGVGLRYLWSMAVEDGAAAESAMAVAYAESFLWSSLPLTLTSAVVFYASGLYTHGRRYRVRYKALIVLQAVSLTYLVFSLEVLLLRGIVPLPRSVLIIAWLATLLFLISVRLWRALRAALLETDDQPVAPETSTQPARKVLVIGGAGYIGSALVRRLLELGYYVRTLDLLLYGDEPIAEFYGHPNFEPVTGDFCHIDAVVRAAQGMDSIVHLGAIVGDSACNVCEELTVEVNLRATRTIAEVGKGFGIRRFVFASTCSVYGASDEILDERSALRPLSLYARTKVESEKVLLDLADATFTPIILRFGTIYGLSGRPRFDLVVNILAARAIQEGEVGIVGGGQWRPLVHVRDAAEAIVRMLEAPREVVCGQVFNVGSNEQNFQIAEIGQLIKGMVPAARLVVQPAEDERNYHVCFDKISRAVNYQPKFTVQEGVAEIIEALQSGKIASYKDPRFNNFAFLNQHAEVRQVLLQDMESRYLDPISGAQRLAPAADPARGPGISVAADTRGNASAASAEHRGVRQPAARPIS